MQDRRRHARHPVLLRCALLWGAERKDVICTQVGPAGAFFNQRLDLALGTVVQVDVRSGGLDTPLVRMTAEVVRIVSLGSGWPAGFAVRWTHAQCELGQEALLNVLHGVFRMAAFDTHHIQLHGRVASLDMQLLLGDVVPARARRHSVLTEARVASGTSGGHAPVDVAPRHPSGAVRHMTSREAPAVRTVPTSGGWMGGALLPRSPSGMVQATPVQRPGGDQQPPPLPPASSRAATPPPLPAAAPQPGLGFAVPHDARPAGLGFAIPAAAPPFAAPPEPATPMTSGLSAAAPAAPSPLAAQPHLTTQRTPSAQIALPPPARTQAVPGIAGGAARPARTSSSGWKPPSIGMGPTTDPFGFDLTVLAPAEAEPAFEPPAAQRPAYAPPAPTSAQQTPMAVELQPPLPTPLPAPLPPRIRPISEVIAAERPLSRPHIDAIAPEAPRSHRHASSGVHLPGPGAGARHRPISEIIAGQGPLTPLPHAGPRPISHTELPITGERTATDVRAPDAERAIDPRVMQNVDLPMTWLRHHQLAAGTLVGLSTVRAAVVSSLPGPDPHEPVVLNVPVPVDGVWQPITLIGRLQPGASADGDTVRFVVAVERVDEGKHPGALQQFLLARGAG